MSDVASELTIAAVLAPAVGRFTVDPLTGAVSIDDRGAVLSAADAAALEVALQLGEAWSLPVTALSAGGDLAVAVLRHSLGVGVSRAVHIDLDAAAPPETVAAALADALTGPTNDAANVFVIAGVHGSDVASAAVPAYLAHHLAAEQALGLIAVEPGEAGTCTVTRRLDRGARERLGVAAPAVVSVEGSVARLRRAALRSVLASDEGQIEQVHSTASATVRPELVPRPWRPRTQVVAGPDGGAALDRIRDLTGVAGPTRQSRTIEVDPAEAADAILAQLNEWGAGPASTSSD